MKGNRTKLVVTLFALMALLISNSLAYCSICAKLKEDPWANSAQSFLSDNSTAQTPSAHVTIQQAVASNPTPKRVDPQRSGSFQQALASVSSFAPTGASSARLSPSGYDVILDVSPQGTEYIKGAISIPYSKFMNNGSLKPISEVATILGGRWHLRAEFCPCLRPVPALWR